MLRNLKVGKYKAACDSLLKWKYVAKRDCSIRKNNCYGVWTRQVERHSNAWAQWKELITGLVTKFYEAIIITLMVFLLLALCWGGFKTWQSSQYKSKFKGAEAAYQLKLNQQKQQHIDDLTEIQRKQNESMQDILIAVNASEINYEDIQN